MNYIALIVLHKTLSGADVDGSSVGAWSRSHGPPKQGLIKRIVAANRTGASAFLSLINRETGPRPQSLHVRERGKAKVSVRKQNARSLCVSSQVTPVFTRSTRLTLSKS